MFINKALLYGVGGLLIGFLLSNFLQTTQFSPSRMMTSNQEEAAKMHEEMSTMNDGMTMDDMVGSLKGKAGNDFDKTFLTEMIDHHQGAIDMAKLAQASAGHDEIKKMANDIISAQEKEILQMKQWQSEWGF
ncbi:MAG: DUF305 domain-containing protein [Candidatus Levybacteria bacterium]|nr:DUF305 domain-containing protein [Candidatus Levybacteria bacterium]